jgi:predicted nucleic acid-binding Zn ribbon protein
MKKCFKCGQPLRKGMDVCPECRERQPVRKLWKYWAALVAAILAWLAFGLFK